ILVKKKVGTPALHLVPTVRHLVSQSQAEREIRLQFHFILNVPGPQPLPVAQRSHHHVGIKRRGRILEKDQQGRISDRAGFVLSRPALVFLYALQPSTEAEGVVAFGDVHIVAAGKQIHRICSRIVPVRHHDSRGGRGTHTSPDGDLARNPPGDERKVRRDRHGGRCYDWRIRSRKAPVEAIQKGGGEDVRLLQ